MDNKDVLQNVATCGLLPIHWTLSINSPKCTAVSCSYVFSFRPLPVQYNLCSRCTCRARDPWDVFATLGSNLRISALLEILQSCKLDHEVALFSYWLPPTHPPTTHHPPTARSKLDNNHWISLGMCLKTVCRLRKVSGRCLEVVWKVSGGCL